MFGNRRYIIAANWKMHMTPLETDGFLRTFLRFFKSQSTVDVVVAPPFISMAEASKALSENNAVALAAQDVATMLTTAADSVVALAALDAAMADTPLVDMVPTHMATAITASTKAMARELMVRKAMVGARPRRATAPTTANMTGE